MGKGNSKLEKHLEGLPDDGERYFGLDNLGQTCYMNSVLHALYFCAPFRKAVLHQKFQPNDDSLLHTLAELFEKIQYNKKKSGTLRPNKFANKLNQENCMFEKHEQQDAQEFLTYLLTSISESLAKNNRSKGGNKKNSSPEPTWVEGMFGGKISSETTCLMCETVKTRDEDSMLMSLMIEQNTSITHCFKNYSKPSFLRGDDKFHCETCCSYQEAITRSRIKTLPTVLAIQLNRFSFNVDAQKLSYRVVYPLELRVFGTTDDAINGNRIYDLAAVVVHVGSRVGCGHYMSVVRSGEMWLRYDDEYVEMVPESYLDELFGLTESQQAAQTRHQARHADTAYMLMYVDRTAQKI